MALTLKDLTEDERVALVALLGQAITADAHTTPAESRRVKAIAAALGPARYEEAAASAEQRFRNEEEFWRFLGTVERQEARELIYEHVLETALADAPVRAESDLLARLAHLWQITVTIPEPPQ